MTISEIKACRQSGLTEAQLLQQVTAAHMAALRADEVAIARVWRPAYARVVAKDGIIVKVK